MPTFSYIIYLTSAFNGTAQEKDDAAYAAAVSLRDRIATIAPGRAVQVDYPDENTPARGFVPNSRGYAVYVGGAESVLTPEEIGAIVTSLPDDGARGWGDVDLSGGGV